MRGRWCAAVGYAVTLMVAAAGQSCAQQTTGTAVVIRVTDLSGAVIPKAQVRVAPVPDNAPEKMETNEKGDLRLQLKPGGYGLVVQFVGFKTFAAHLDVRETGEPQIMPVVLQIGQGGGPVVVLEAPKAGTIALSVVPFQEEFRIGAEQLKELPRSTVTVPNEHSSAEEKYEGVLLVDLLRKYGAPVGKEMRGPAVTLCVVATGSDGYEAVLSLAEVDPSFHSGEVLVAERMNGAPLDAKSGPFKLVVTEDKGPARWVRNLVRLRVVAAQ